MWAIAKSGLKGGLKGGLKRWAIAWAKRWLKVDSKGKSGLKVKVGYS